MQQVGVQAIVAGLSSFLGDMKKIDSSIKDLIPGSNLLSRAFEGVGSVVQWLTGSVFRVLEYTLGNLIAGAIRDIISEIKELISATIEAGSEFQSLEIRLRNFNLNTLIEAGQDYATASQDAIAATKEQLTWLQKLAATTPYDLTDIANVFTLARSYGFASEKSKTMTESITNFAAGMGLGNTEIERIIVNFGQMVQQGKVTQREMNDLARGAFVPVNDVLRVMQEQTGLTGSAFDDFRNSAEGVEAFMVAFETLASQRFAGATTAMAQTWKGATDNVKDFIKSLFGLNVVKPVLDVLGKNIAEFINAFTSGQRWEAMVNATTRIGNTLSEIITHVMHLGAGAEGMADRFLSAVESVADWLEAHQGDIQQWLEDGIAWIRNVAIPKLIEFKDFLFGTDTRKSAIRSLIDWLIGVGVPFIQNQVVPVFETLVYIIKSLAPALEPLQNLFLAVGGVIAAAFGAKEPKDFATFVNEVLVPAINGLTNFINNNRAALALLLQAFLAFAVIGSIIALFVSMTVKVIAFTATLLTLIPVLMTQIPNAVSHMATMVVSMFNFIQTAISNMISNAIGAILRGDWAGAGRSIIQGLYNGIVGSAGIIFNAMVSIAKQALAAAKWALGIKSPSREFFRIGEQLMQGFASGITATADLAAKAMQGATAATISIGAMAPARLAGAMAPGTVSNNTTYNFSQTINTSAKTEPIIADFEMMRSMAGV